MGYIFFVRVHNYDYILLLCMVDTAASELAVSKYNHTLVDTRSTGHKEVNPHDRKRMDSRYMCS